MDERNRANYKVSLTKPSWEDWLLGERKQELRKSEKLGREKIRKRIKEIKR